MTALRDYDKWDRIVRDLSDSEPKDEESKLLQRIKERAALASISKPKPQTNLSSHPQCIPCDPSNDNLRDIINKSKQYQKSKKIKSKKKKKPKAVKIKYDALNIPPHSFYSMLTEPFCPSTRLLNNSISPSVQCGTLIHFYSINGLAVFFLFYIINPIILFRLTFFYKSTRNFIVSAYYIHLIRFLFHSIIDIPLSLFDCRIKNANTNKLTKWRWIYIFYSLLMQILCSLLFHMVSLDGPHLTFSQYRHVVMFMRDDSAYDKINEYVSKSDAGNLYHGLVYILILSFVIDLIYICLFIFNAASFKRFSKENAMLYFVRYCAALIRAFVLEVAMGFAVWMMKSEKDPSIWDVLHVLFHPNRAVFILPILTILYCIVTGINNKLQECFARLCQRPTAKQKAKLM